MPNGSSSKRTIEAAVAAFKRGYTPVPIRDGGKNPHISAWTYLSFEDAEDVRRRFGEWAEENAHGIGLLLGKPSGNLVDVDLDNPKALRLMDHFLPPTPMRTGRPSRPLSHAWYIADVPGTRQYKMPDGSVAVELRSTGGQTVIPPSIHPSGEPYRWDGTAWGGKAGPLPVEGVKLSIQVALLGLGSVLLDRWPKQGSRHDAYLALAGGVLRLGTGVHEWWETNLPHLITALTEVTGDEENRVKEVMRTTVDRLRSGQETRGWPSLAEIIGNDHAEQARRLVRQIEGIADPKGNATDQIMTRESLEERLAEQAKIISSLPPEERNPLAEREVTWQPLDLEPYLAGEVRMTSPAVLRREDGRGLMYEGRINTLYGRSESAKSWISLIACQQEMTRGERVMYLDFEDEPLGTLSRMKSLGVGDDEVRALFTYIHPEEPLAMMQRNRWGGENVTTRGMENKVAFDLALTTRMPSLIVVDGMTMLYGLHGLDTNDASSTDIITAWLKSLTNGGRTTVIVIDHTGKGAEAGDSPIGAHHKIAMVQGAAIQAHPTVQPIRGERGVVKLYVFKDRPGAVRQHAVIVGSLSIAATVILDSSEDPDRMRWSIEIPDPDEVSIDGAALNKAAKEAEAKAKREAKAEEERQRYATGTRIVETLYAHGEPLSRPDIEKMMGVEEGSLVPWLGAGGHLREPDHNGEIRIFTRGSTRSTVYWPEPFGEDDTTTTDGGTA